eukprot:2464370-Pleurochrysis_carterae.AAC.1
MEKSDTGYRTHTRNTDVGRGSPRLTRGGTIHTGKTDEGRHMGRRDRTSGTGDAAESEHSNLGQTPYRESRDTPQTIIPMHSKRTNLH